MKYQVTKERYDVIISRYTEFVKSLDNLDVTPVKVFDPLTQKQMDELHLIRDISTYLQKKKDEDKKVEDDETEVSEDKEATKVEKEVKK